MAPYNGERGWDYKVRRVITGACSGCYEAKDQGLLVVMLT